MVKAQSLTQSLTECHHRLVAKVTGKYQITLPRAVVDRCGIRVGDELELRPIGRSIQIEPRAPVDAKRLRRERLMHFDLATKRQRDRRPAASRAPVRSRGWTRDELYLRGRTR